MEATCLVGNIENEVILKYKETTECSGYLLLGTQRLTRSTL